ncbi:hypothetical protein CspHIS471_0605110 [Cutaneotrichosporon sp. HIS471]|nr:hypothetical protein CspHIS471_0605110 [Cutaneotrichosporon sp. HIS471]
MSECFGGKGYGKPSQTRHLRNRDGSWSASASTGYGHGRPNPATSQGTPHSLSDSREDTPAPVSTTSLGRWYQVEDATPKTKRRSSKLRHSRQPSLNTPGGNSDQPTTQPPAPDNEGPTEVTSSMQTESDHATQPQSTVTQRMASGVHSDGNITPAARDDLFSPSEPCGDQQNIPTHLASTNQNSMSSTSGVPTWEGEIHRFKKSRFHPGVVPNYRNIDANCTEVPNPRTWGHGHVPPSQPSSQAVAEEPRLPPDNQRKDDGGWSSPVTRCKNWVASVSPTAFTEPELAAGLELKAPTLDDDKDHDDLPPRPDSARKAIAPTTVYYSDDSGSSPKMASLSPKWEQPEDSESPANVTANPPSAQPTRVRYLPSITCTPLPPASVTPSHRPVHGQSSQPGGLKRWWPHPTKFWRQELHPMHNPLFTSRRICITTPFPFRPDNLKNLMLQHFSKYGPIRLVQPMIHEVDVADTVFVIFKEENSVYELLDDPRSIHCTFQSASRTTSIPFDIKINRVPSTVYTHHIWIKLTGPRPDARSRSASPSFGRFAQVEASDFDTNVLPEEVSVWAVPNLVHRGQRLFYRVFVAGPGFDPTPGFEHAERDTGEACLEIRKINFRRRNPEKEIIVELVDCFVDIIKITKPSERTNHGWILECGAGHRDLEELLTTVRQMPGITIRITKPEEHAPCPSPATTQPGSEASHLVTVNAVGQVEVQSTTKAEENLADHAPTPASVIPIKNPSTLPSTAPSEVAPSDRISSKGTKASQSASDRPKNGHLGVAIHTTEPTCGPTAAEDTGPSRPSSTGSTCPGLVRKLVPMYRGRLLREEIINGQSRFVDDAAIFVGRITKEQETQLTLLKRFERYGRIAAIEYNPHRPSLTQATFGNARILFQDPLSARVAIEKENGAVSFGSTLRVEERRVLPHDVQAREMFIDSVGRAISPSMVSQYSPPSPPALPKFSFSHSAASPPLEQLAPWLNATGGPPTMPAVMRTAMVVPAHSNYGGELQGMMMPVMWPMGFGAYPGMMAPSISSMQQGSPMSGLFMPHIASSPPNQPRPNEPSSSPPRTPDGKRFTPPSSNTKATYGTTGPPTPPSDKSAVSTVPRARVTGARYQDGLFIPTYDADDLKTWREAQGIEDNKLGSTVAPADREYLPLLPIFTGGHDPASTLPTPQKDTPDKADGCALSPADSSKKHPHQKPCTEYARRSFSSGRSTFSGDAVRLSEAAARQAANPDTREHIRAQLSQSFQVHSGPTHHSAVPIPVPFSAEAGPSHGRRGSSSTLQRESRAPRQKGRLWDDAQRHLGPQPRVAHQQREFAPTTAHTPVSHVMDEPAENNDWTGW